MMVVHMDRILWICVFYAMSCVAYGQVCELSGDPCQPPVPCELGSFMSAPQDCEMFQQCVAPYEWTMVNTACGGGKGSFSNSSCDCDPTNTCEVWECPPSPPSVPPPIQSEPCFTEPPECTTVYQTVPDRYYCTKYFECSEGVWISKTCPDNTPYFDNGLSFLNPPCRNNVNRCDFIPFDECLDFTTARVVTTTHMTTTTAQQTTLKTTQVPTTTRKTTTEQSTTIVTTTEPSTSQPTSTQQTTEQATTVLSTSEIPTTEQTTTFQPTTSKQTSPDFSTADELTSDQSTEQLTTEFSTEIISSEEFTTEYISTDEISTDAMFTEDASTEAMSTDQFSTESTLSIRTTSSQQFTTKGQTTRAPSTSKSITSMPNLTTKVNEITTPGVATSKTTTTSTARTSDQSTTSSMISSFGSTVQELNQSIPTVGFNESTGTADYSSVPTTRHPEGNEACEGLPQCTNERVRIAHRTECSLYFECVEDSWELLDCRDSKSNKPYFNPKKQKCQMKFLVDCSKRCEQGSGMDKMTRNIIIIVVCCVVGLILIIIIAVCCSKKDTEKGSYYYKDLAAKRRMSPPESDASKNKGIQNKDQPYTPYQIYHVTSPESNRPYQMDDVALKEYKLKDEMFPHEWEKQNGLNNISDATDDRLRLYRPTDIADTNKGVLNHSAATNQTYLESLADGPRPDKQGILDL